MEQAITSADVTSVIVTVSAADMQARTTALVKTNNQWSGVIGKVAAGTGRTFSAEAFNSSGTKLYGGAATGVTILAKQTTAVSITLQEVTPPPPFANAAPVITSLSAAPGTVEPGGTVALNASASDANAGDTLTYAWSASSGSFAQSSSLSTTWTAPASAATVPLTLTVTDSKGLQGKVTFNVNVTSGKGDAAVNASLNTWPQVSNLSASATALEVNEFTTVSAIASDNDGDTLAYSWTASCPGTWSNATSATAQFTATALPASNVCNNCTVTVTVTDFRNNQPIGGQTTGTLSICVGPKRTALFPPDITETFQSSPSTSANGTVTFRVKAVDPQGSAMSFSWAANTGTPGTPTSGSDASEVVWTAPACAPSTPPPTLTATVSNALGASASHSFTVTGLPTCSVTSCKALLESNASTPSGVYTVDPDGDGPGAPFSVFCDMTTAGGGWTVVEKSPYGDPIGTALFKNAPANESSPGLTRHRLSLTRMGALQAISTSMRIDCRGSDYLLTAATNLFSGEGGPNSCANAQAILYTDASLKGRRLLNTRMCTWFIGTSEGCTGAWHVDESAQSSYCGLPNYPWAGTAITTHSADTFGVDPLKVDTSGGHDCHTTGAVRHVLLR